MELKLMGRAISAVGAGMVLIFITKCYLPRPVPDTLGIVDPMGRPKWSNKGDVGGDGPGEYDGDISTTYSRNILETDSPFGLRRDIFQTRGRAAHTGSEMMIMI